MALPLPEMAAASGLDFYNDPAALLSKQGVLIGVRNGFFICAGALGTTGRIGVIARFKSCADPSALLTALKQNPAMKKMYTIWNAQVTGPQTILWSYNKPMRFNKENFAGAIEGFAQTLSLFATPFDVTKCEGCNAPVQQMVLANGCPTSMCSACQAKAEQEKQAERQQYEAGDSNLAKAFIFGLLAAVVAGAVWALLAYWDYNKGTYHPKLHIALAFGVGMLVAWGVKLGVGRINLAACVLTSVLTAVGKIGGDILFYSMVIAKEQSVQLSTALFRWTALHIWQVKWEFSAFMAIMDVVAVLCAGAICWGMRPKFALTFKSLPMPRSASKPMAPAARSASATSQPKATLA